MCVFTVRPSNTDQETAIKLFLDALHVDYEKDNDAENAFLTQGITIITAESDAFDFLKNEEDLYTMADLKEVYND